MSQLRFLHALASLKKADDVRRFREMAVEIAFRFGFQINSERLSRVRCKQTQMLRNGRLLRT